MITEPQPCGWSVFRDPWEVMPNDDICGHVSGMQCRCRPYMDEDDLITHVAFDGREDFQSGKRLLS